MRTHLTLQDDLGDASSWPAMQQFPLNPNGSIHDIAGICDATGHIFGLMPHPEAYNHFTNHPDWPGEMEKLKREPDMMIKEPGIPMGCSTLGISIFINAVNYMAALTEIN